MKKSVLTILWFLFAIYFFTLFLFLLSGFRIRREDLSLNEYISLFTNFVPFRSIVGYLEMLKTDFSSAAATLAIMNLTGNLLLFLPMGALLPCLFKRLRKFLKTMFAVFLMVFIAECLQVLLKTGCFDVDDFILNISGAAAGYGLWRIRSAHIISKASPTAEGKLL